MDNKAAAVADSHLTALINHLLDRFGQKTIPRR
jgi:hypothetical protein